MADTALAAGMLMLRRRASGAALMLDPALEIGAGGEARVLRLPGDDTLVAKLYREPTLERARKLARMIEAPPALEGAAALAWPVDLLTDLNGGRFAGFLMPRAEGPRIFEFYNPVSRRRAAPDCDWGLLHRAGVSLAAAFDALHGHGYVVGDVNESNILLSPAQASVTLVDADSFQVRDPSGAIYRSAVGKAEFTPPELQGARFSDVDRAPGHDRFGLAALLFLLLMEGTHPFAARFGGEGEALPVEERIRRRLYPYASAEDDCKPPRLAPPLGTLHPGLQALFARCFVDGHADPAARPTAAEWRAALAVAEQELRGCEQNPRHRFATHVPYCPWCHRTRLLQGRDPFPASVELARATDRAPLVRSRAPVSIPIPAARPTPPMPAAPPVPSAPNPVLAPIAAFLANAQAALPPWIAGPTALASPIPWVAPAALTILYGTTGGLRVMAMMAGFLALRRVFRAGPGGFTALTAMWTVALMLLWSIVGVAGGSYFGGGLDADADAASSARIIPVQRYAREVIEVDRAPYLLNQDEVDRALRDVVKSLPYSISSQGGNALLHFVVNVDGTVDPTTVSVVGASSDEFAKAAAGVAEWLRFEPARLDDRSVAVWTDFTVTFPSR